MSRTYQTQSTESVKEALMQRLTAQDPSALKLIRLLEKRARAEGDARLLGYVYYRYAYYYYFTVFDHNLFRRYLQQAIRHLLRTQDAEYLASTYNLVAYDAQDHGCFDLAYAYFRLAVSVSEPLKGISLSGLVEASAGRLMIELGRAKEGRAQIKRAILKLKPITTMHVYHYNMIINHADEALASFILEDETGVAHAMKQIESHFEKADKDERHLSMTYYLLPAIYDAVLKDDSDRLNALFKKLYAFWRALPGESGGGLIFEVENVFHALLKHGYVRQAGRLLKETAALGRDENLTIAMRHLVMQHTYYVRTRNVKMQRLSLRAQHEIHLKRSADQTRVHRYALEFLDMIGEITTEHANAIKEQEKLKKQAVTDALTNLPNRAVMNGELARLFEDAKENGSLFAVGIMDVDYFKIFNDTYGHQAGDLCLSRIGEILRRLMEERHVFCARYGGDEFVICLTGCTAKEICGIAKEISRAVKEIRFVSGKQTIDATVTVSHGICADVPAKGEKLWDYLSHADDALYRMKKRRLGNFCIVNSREKI